MKLAKTLATIACAALLSAGVLGSARLARAQDAARRLATRVVLEHHQPRRNRP